MGLTNKTCECIVQPFTLKLNMNTENDEDTKIRKRSAAVEAVKRTPAYILTRLHEAPNRCPTPDPLEKMSKRQWENSVMTWRAELREMLRDLSDGK